MEFDVKDEKEIKKLSKRIQAVYRSLGGKGDPEDCAQEILARILVGRHKKASLEQAVIDYLRDHGINNRNVSSPVRRELLFASSYEQGKFDRKTATEELDITTKIDGEILFNMSKHWERAVMILYFREDYSLAAIAEMFGVTESAACLWIKTIQARTIKRVMK